MKASIQTNQKGKSDYVGNESFSWAFKGSREGGTISQAPGSSVKHIHDTWSCGFLGDIRISPTNVSFYNQLFMELAATPVSSGWLAGFPGNHLQSAVQIRVNSTNTVNESDEIFSGAKAGPYGEGSWHWDIPWRMNTNLSGRQINFVTIRQQSTSDATGKCIISKGGLSRSRVPSDPTSTF